MFLMKYMILFCLYEDKFELMSSLKKVYVFTTKPSLIKKISKQVEGKSGYLFNKNLNLKSF